MRSIDILLNNLQKYYNISSLRKISKKIGVSESILLNWSSGRSSPSLKQLDEIAYLLNVEVSELLINNANINISSPIWRDNISKILIENIGRFKQEKGINKLWFDTNDSNISYWSFLYYLNGKNKSVNLETLDELAKILDVQVYQLLERRKPSEKEN
ncbi:helix-turn-helix domain-containing protein [Ligilactobacillus agilis]|nr:helix-turn-helix domain-containing protein [Ligilactobacillus agilis]